MCGRSSPAANARPSPLQEGKHTLQRAGVDACLKPHPRSTRKLDLDPAVGGAIAPQRNDQFACERHDHDAPNTALQLADTAVVPLRNLALRLVSEPHPGHLDGGNSRPGIAGLVDPLIAPGFAAVIRRRGQPEIACHLSSIVESSVEHFPRQGGGEIRADAMQLCQPAHLLHIGIGGRLIRLEMPVPLDLDRLDLLGYRLEALPFAFDLDLQALRDWPSVPRSHLGKAFAPLRIGDAQRPDAMVIKSALIRLMWPVRSRTKRCRSRCNRLASSSSGVGTFLKFISRTNHFFKRNICAVAPEKL